MSAQQGETRYNVGRYHVQVPEELREQLGHLRKRTLKIKETKGCREKS